MLGDLIKIFEACPDGAVFKEGFNNTHSYRGDYQQLAVEPCGEATKEDILSVLKEALDSTYEGYKGGEYPMFSGVDVYLAYEGCTSDKLVVGWAAEVGKGFVLSLKGV